MSLYKNHRTWQHWKGMIVHILTVVIIREILKSEWLVTISVAKLGRWGFLKDVTWFLSRAGSTKKQLAALSSSARAPEAASSWQGDVHLRDTGSQGGLGMSHHSLASPLSACTWACRVWGSSDGNFCNRVKAEQLMNAWCLGPTLCVLKAPSEGHTRPMCTGSSAQIGFCKYSLFLPFIFCRWPKCC